MPTKRSVAVARFLPLATLLTLFATLLTLFGCRRCSETPAHVDAGTSDAGDDAAATPLRSRKGSSDVTFVVVSDTHFGFGGIEAAHEVLIPKLNGIAGRPYPRQLGGTVGAPRGLLITGDLTEWGKVEEWQPFVRTYGLDGGTDGKLSMPVFEVIGNHDRVHGPWVEEQVAARHGGRFYAFDWDGLHIVALGEAPDDEALAFLARDLGQLARDVPIVLYFHLALAGPWSTSNWFAEGRFKERLGAIVERRNVVAIFHGHHHATEHYLWHGVDVFKPGAVKDGAHTFAVVHLTDDRMTVASFDWDQDAWGAIFDKRLLPQKR